MLKRWLCIVIFAVSACAPRPLLEKVSLDPDAISPFAGSPNRATTIRYTLSRDAHVSIYLLDARGRIVAQADHQPQAGQYPTSIWDVGEQVRDDFSLTVPTHLSDGSYRFEIGWYDLSTGKRLALSDGADHLLLDTALEVGR